MYKISASCQMTGLDDILMKCFGFKHDGVFVEAGAHDGYSFSNTWGLAEAGWRGVYYEPSPALAARCGATHAYNNVVVRCTAVGNKVEESTKLWLGNNPLSAGHTMVEKAMKTWAFGDTYDDGRFIMVPVTTLDVDLQLVGITPGFDLLCIDTEGAEPAVLQGFTWEYWHPKMIIIEDHDNSDPRENWAAAEINEWFSKTPYKRIYHDNINSVYVL